MSESTLHILNRGPNQPQLLQHCRDAFDSGDALILIEDGVYWAREHYSDQLKELVVYALTADLEARGVTPAGYETVDDAGFVDLCVSHSRSVSWT